MSDRRRWVVVLFGGQSCEHEVSCRSAAFAARTLDTHQYRVRLVGIDKSGSWWPRDLSEDEKKLGQLSVRLPFGNADLPCYAQNEKGGSIPRMVRRMMGFEATVESEILVLPLIHGSYGEDGRLQGLLEMAELPYVGSGTLSCAIAMDKVVAKTLVSHAGVKVVPFDWFHGNEWSEAKASIIDKIADHLGFPVFVKPAGLGSSVGIGRCANEGELEAACEKALEYDHKVLVEKAIQPLREIEFAILGEEKLRISGPGEVITKSEFYSYEAKYLDASSAEICIPAILSEKQKSEAIAVVEKAIKALDVFGMARIDLFIDTETGQLYFNEVNSIPGFTAISQYPLLWAYEGVAGKELLEALLSSARSRFEKKKRLVLDSALQDY